MNVKEMWSRYLSDQWFREKIKVICLRLFVGTMFMGVGGCVVAAHSSWWVALGVFVMIWANNISAGKP